MSAIVAAIDIETTGLDPLYTDHLTMEIKTEGVKSLMEEVENESNLNDN